MSTSLSHQCCETFTGCALQNVSNISSWLCSFTDAWRGLAPRYLSDYIQRVADSNRRRLRSSSSSQLVIRRTRLSTVGDRAFPVAGRHHWNRLPPDVTSAPTLTVFSEPPQSFSYLFTIISFLTVFGFAYSSGLAVLYVSHSE